jgi:class 3 adenylate cyclase
VCIPLVHQNHLAGAIYLENNLVNAAFTRRRIEMLKLICSHAVIAIENASLYSDLARHSQDLRRINGSMDRFVPKEFLACLGKSTLLDVALGQNVHREMSVLFSDIRGFTTMVEGMAPAEHIGFINEYLSYMEPAILQNNGFVDSYIGDAIMALFGEGPDAAVQAGVDMGRGLSTYNQLRKQAGAPPVKMGVGLNTGSLTLGTIGGPSRIKCGVIGDSVNLAARIEALTKRYQAFMLMSGNTRDSLSEPEKYPARVVGKVLVSGRHQPVTLYEVIEAEQDPALKDGKLETMATYAKAVDFFYARNFGEAGRYFAECVARCPGDVSARHYQRECLENLGREVGADWTGVVSVPGGFK